MPDTPDDTKPEGLPAADGLVAFRVPSSDPNEQRVVVWDAFAEVSEAPGGLRMDPQELARLALSFDRPKATFTWVENPEADKRVPSPARKLYFPDAAPLEGEAPASPPSTYTGDDMCGSCAHAAVCAVRVAARSANIQLGVSTCSKHNPA